MSDRMTSYKISDISQNRNPTAGEYTDYRQYLREEAGTEVLPVEVDDKLYAKAWEMGHSSGYHEVELMYCDLADLVVAAYRAK